eukprot:753016_1
MAGRQIEGNHGDNSNATGDNLKECIQDLQDILSQTSSDRAKLDLYSKKHFHAFPEDLVNNLGALLLHNDAGMRQKASEKMCDTLLARNVNVRPLFGDDLVCMVARCVRMCESVRDAVQCLRVAACTAQACSISHSLHDLFQLYWWAAAEARSLPLHPPLPPIDLLTSPRRPSAIQRSSSMDAGAVPSLVSLRPDDISSLSVSRVPGKPRVEPESPIDVASAVLQCLHEISKFRGPSSFFSFKDLTPLFLLIPHIDWNPSGYAFSCWIRLRRREANEAPANIFSFLSEAGAGIQVHILPRETSRDPLRIRVRSVPESLTGIVFEMPRKFRGDQWFLMACSHSERKGHDAEFSLYINNYSPSKKRLPLPKPSNAVHCTIGGFSGSMANLYFYSETLLQDTVSSVYTAGPDYFPPLSSRPSPTPRQSVATVATFPVPPSVRLRAAHEVGERRANFKLGVLVGIHASGTEGIICLPLGWDQPSRQKFSSLGQRRVGSGAGKVGGPCRSHAERMDGVTVSYVPNKKDSFRRAGGLLFFFEMLSPYYRGPEFYSDRQVVSMLELLSELVWYDPAMQMFLTEIIGVESVRYLILEQVHPRFRTRAVLRATRHLLLAVQSVGHSQVLRGLQTLLLDYRLWGRCDELVQKAALDVIESSLAENWNIFARHLPINHLLEWVQFVHFECFRIRMKDVPNPVSDLSLGKRVLSWVLPFAEQVGFTTANYRAFMFALTNCTQPAVRVQLLKVLAKLLSKFPNMFQYINHNFTDIEVFIELMVAGEDKTRVLCLKILVAMFEYTLNYIPTNLSQFGSGFEVAIARHLALTPLTPVMYSLILRAVVGKCRLLKQLELAVDEHTKIKHLTFFECLLKMGAKAPTSLKTRILVDVHTLLSSNSDNREFLSRHPTWPSLLIPLYSPPETMDSDYCNQLVNRLINLMLIHCMTTHVEGWEHFYRVYWALRKLNNSVPRLSEPWKGVYELMLRVCRRFLSQVLSHIPATQPAVSPQFEAGTDLGDEDSTHGAFFSSDNLNETSKALLLVNLPPMLKFVEFIMFHHPKSFLYNARRRSRISNEENIAVYHAHSQASDVQAQRSSPSDQNVSRRKPSLSDEQPTDPPRAGQPDTMDTNLLLEQLRTGGFGFDSSGQEGSEESRSRHASRKSEVAGSGRHPDSRPSDPESLIRQVDRESGIRHMAAARIDSSSSLASTDWERVPAMRSVGPPGVVERGSGVGRGRSPPHYGLQHIRQPSDSSQLLQFHPSTPSMDFMHASGASAIGVATGDHSDHSGPSLASSDGPPTGRPPSGGPHGEPSSAINDVPMEDEVLMFDRFLRCLVGYLDFSQERQHILRVILRCLKFILGNKFCDRLVLPVSELVKYIFISRMSDKRSDTDLRTTRVALTFIKDASDKYVTLGDPRHADDMNDLIMILATMKGADKLFQKPFVSESDSSILSESQADAIRSADEVKELILETESQCQAEVVLHDHMDVFKRRQVRAYMVQNEHIRKVWTIWEVQQLEYEKYYRDQVAQYDRVRDARNDRESAHLLTRHLTFGTRRRRCLGHIHAYMQPFREELETRRAGGNGTEEGLHWMLDNTECEDGTRILLRRNFTGGSHPEATVERGSVGVSVGPAEADQATPAVPSGDFLALGKSLAGTNAVRSGEEAKEEDGKSFDEMDDSDVQAHAADAFNQSPDEVYKKVPEPKASPKASEAGGPAVGNEPASAPNEPANVSGGPANVSGEPAKVGGKPVEDGEAGSKQHTEVADWYIVEDFPETKQGDVDMGSIVHTATCTLVTPLQKIEGEFRLSETHFGFFGSWYVDSVADTLQLPSSDPFPDDHGDYKEETGEADTTKDGIADALTQASATGRLGRVGPPFATITAYVKVRLVLPRRYLLRENGIEVFNRDCSSMFFTFESKKTRNYVLKLLSRRCHFNYELSDQRRLKMSGLTKKWQQREISNFQYLMEINELAGRSFNDITQYPVFPWILTDYTSETINLHDPSVYRDLSKPIGSLNEDRLEIFKERYEETAQDRTFPPFHYGSHYSSAGIVLHYLLRLEPFCTLAIHQQGGHFDLADRLFNSIDGAWNMSYTNVSDVKELIPEFFYLPEFLKNMNGLDLGLKQDGRTVNGVILPPWASSAEEFIRIHREALESDYVSAHLHEWIDLIFGFKQRGEEAVGAYNVFFHLTYAGSVDIASIDDPALRAATEAQIYHFGQTPSQLFLSPHPARFPVDDCSVSSLSLPHALPPSFRHTLIKSFPQRAFPRTLSVTKRGDSVTVVDRRGGVHCQNVFDSEPMGTSSSSTNTSQILCDHWRVVDETHPQIACVTRNGNFLLTGGYLDNSMKVHRLPDRSPLASICSHQTVVTAMAIDHSPSDMHVLVTGSQDGTLMLWRGIPDNSSWPGEQFEAVPSRLHSPHRSPVVSVAVSCARGVVVSLCGAHKLATYALRRQSFLRCIDLSHLERFGEAGKNLGIASQEDDLLPSPSSTEPAELSSIPSESSEPWWREDGEKKVVISAAGRLIVHRVTNGVSSLHLFTINGDLLRSLPLDEHLLCLVCAPKTEMVISGGTGGSVVFRNCYDLSIVQTFPCLPEPLPIGRGSPPNRRSLTDALLMDSNEKATDGDDILSRPLPEMSYRISALDIAPSEQFVVVGLTDGRLLMMPLPNLAQDCIFRRSFEDSQLTLTGDSLLASLSHDRRDSSSSTKSASMLPQAVESVRSRVWGAVQGVNPFRRSNSVRQTLTGRNIEVMRPSTGDISRASLSTSRLAQSNSGRLSRSEADLFSVSLSLESPQASVGPPSGLLQRTPSASQDGTSRRTSSNVSGRSQKSSFLSTGSKRFSGKRPSNPDQPVNLKRDSKPKTKPVPIDEEKATSNKNSRTVATPSRTDR